MCYHISFSSDIDLITDYIPNAVVEEQLTIDFTSTIHLQGFTFPEYPIVYQNIQDGKPHIRPMEWGVIKSNVKNEAAYKIQRIKMLNIRSERILGDEGSEWFKLKGNRCIIPLNGFYEHRKIELKGWKKKVPYLVKVKDEKLIFVAGLYNVVNLGGKERWTFGLCTTAANEVMKNIHNDGEYKWRMPLILPMEKAMRWIAEDLTDTEYKELIEHKTTSEQIDFCTVYTIAGKDAIRPDGKGKNEPYEWEGLPALGEANPVYEEQ